MIHSSQSAQCHTHDPAAMLRTVGIPTLDPPRAETKGKVAQLCGAHYAARSSGVALAICRLHCGKLPQQVKRPRRVTFEMAS